METSSWGDCYIKILPLCTVMESCFFSPSGLYSEGLMNSKDCQGEQIQTSFSPFLPKLTLLSYFWNCFGPCLVKSSYKRWVGSERCFCSAQILSTFRVFSGPKWFWSKVAMFPASVGDVSTRMWWTLLSHYTYLLTCYCSSASSRATVLMYRKTAILKPVKHVGKQDINKELWPCVLQKDK